jgi:hypothetical protein
MDSKKLAEFYADARKHCGYENAKPRKMPDGTEVLGPYKKGRFTFTDTFQGSEEFDGFTVVRDGAERLVVSYYGRADPEFADMAYNFLRDMLRQFPIDQPFRRGPVHFRDGKLVYINTFLGTPTNFRNKENILFEDREIYFYADKGEVLPF